MDTIKFWESFRSLRAHMNRMATVVCGVVLLGSISMIYMPAASVSSTFNIGTQTDRQTGLRNHSINKTGDHVLDTFNIGQPNRAELNATASDSGRSVLSISAGKSASPTGLEISGKNTSSRNHSNPFGRCPGTVTDLIQEGYRVMSYEELKQYQPQNFPFLTPPPYLPRFASPCWLQEMRHEALQDGDLKNVKVMCFPAVYLAGMPKSGTTDLYALLAVHHDIVTPKSKEPHWWTRNLHGFYGRAISIEAYTEDIRHPQLGSCSNGESGWFFNQLTLDASASTFWDMSMWMRALDSNRGRDEPETMLAHVIQHFTPRARVILIMRDPVERLYSAYLYFSGGNLSSSAFHTLGQRHVTRFKNCTRQHSVRACAYAPYVKVTRSPKQPGPGYQPDMVVSIHLQVGLYSVYAADWLRILSRDRIHFLRTEDYSNDKTAEMRKILQFLYLDEQHTPEYQNTDTKRNQRKPSGKSAGDMLPATRKLLQKFYAPFNRQLAELLEDDRYLWGYS